MTKTIALMGAMDEEVGLLLGEMTNTRSRTAAGIRFTEGLFRGCPVVVCRCGVGKVNAAAAAQVLASEFRIEALVFTGVAGALDPALEIGDIVVSSESVQHDMDASPLGFARGIIPFQTESVFPADPDWVRLAEESCKAAGVRFATGRVLSGDRFVADREEVAKLREEFGGACTEMEGAAVAQVCRMNGIPHVIIRSMSDKANGAAPESFAEFTAAASARSFGIVSGMLELRALRQP
ncbi:5'-methylthioadenosine/adenosylhomocysteine nucleosidase [Saccharibacillus sp. CPCC 101409]|uniref:5'-methylthioadenosine/adenosylhomocysteine nucleosidase n=1 Tax=Saccharibacillus sp. CPCC 101409 TaxID=3058041 RepID=UPI002673F269|nr:5'-methylthioadenosine/adenosylhomocysteine nucleosidase [Saccharibacillus sp. CPCC 101409]MDO3409351.1 5'-methylthioadenosine/adenosylhomocysteine nucleosidase [Saccharibacillus sp. CPCC 101409]